MNKGLLIILIFAVILLSWNFVFSPKKVGLTDQARVLQGLSSAIAYKTAVRKYWEEKRTLPDHDDWNKEKQEVVVDLSKTIVESIQVGEYGPGVISVNYAARQDLDSPADIDGKIINLIPDVQSEKLVWSCLGNLPVNLLPKNCNQMETGQIESIQKMPDD